MSTTIDQKIVQMQFDNSNFERNVTTSMSTLDKLKKALKFDGASKGLEDIQKSANKVNFSGMSSGIDAMTQKFSYMQMTIQHQLNNIVDSAVNAGKRMVSALTIDPVKTGFQEYETQINSVQTILANTQHNGTTLDEVNSALDTLNTYADKTIYNFTEMTRNIGTFTAAGVDLQTSVESIQGIANLAAVSGSTSQQASTAMYQLSQALAAGKVSLMDWNSVVNAGMGGKVFQDALIRTSELLKTGAKDAIAANGSFRESLTKSGWLTTEVLTETLKQFAGAYSEADLIAQGFTEKQAKEIASMAVTAQDAATKVKTFTQLWDTLKEAAQSGWTQTWEIIVGDFDEAKGLLTSISDTVGDIINKSSESRNKLLGDTLNSPWKKLIDGINDAGIKTDDFQKKVQELYDTAKGEGSFDKVVEKYGSFEEACRKGAISSGILKEAIASLNGEFVDLSNIKKDLKLGDTGEDVKKVQQALKNLNYDIGKTGVDGILGSATEDAIKAFQEAKGLKITGVVDEETIAALEKASGSAGKFKSNIDELIANLDELGGREKLIESFKNIWEGLLSVIRPVKMAFQKVFPPTTAEQLTSIIDNFHSLTKKMTVSAETSGKIYNAFKGVFSVISFGIGILKAIGSGFVSIVSSLFGFSGSILDAAGALGKWISNCIDSAKENNILVTGIETITSIITGAIAKIQEFGKALKESFKTPNVSGIFGFFTSLWNIITQIGSSIASTIGSVFDTVSDAFGKGDIFEVLNSGLIAGIFLGVKKFTKSLDDAFEGTGGFLENVTGILDDVRGCFQAYQDQLKAGTLFKIASAIAMLAAAIFVISTIDADSLNRSLGAITVLFVELLGSLAIFDKMGGKFKGAIKAIPLMLALSAAILILASAMKVLSGLDVEGLMKGLVGITGLVYILTEAAKKMDSNSKTITKFAGQMILMSVAIGILAVVAKSLGSMSWGELAKSGAGILGITVILVSAAKIMDGKSAAITKFAGQMILMSVAIGILAVVAKSLGSMSWGELAKAGVGLFGMVALLVASAKIMDGKSAAITKFAGQMLLMSAAIVVLSIGLEKIGEMSVGSIIKSLITLAGAFVIIGIAGAVLSPLIPAILGLAGAFALLGIGMVGIGAGLMMIGAGIASITVGLSAGATSIVAGLTAIILGILNLVPEIAEIIGRTILEVAAILGEYAPQLAESLCKLIVESVKSLAAYTPQLVDSLLDLLIGVINSLADHVPELIVAFTNLLAKVFEGVVEALNGADTENLLKGIVAVGLMGVLAYVLAGIVTIIPAAMIGLAGVGILIAELAFVLAAIGGIAQIPGLKWLINEGGEFLAQIGHALGYAIGALISGIGEGLTSGLPQIGQNIADFMAKLAIASDNASGIQPGSFDGVSDLVGALSSIAMTTVGTSISDIFTLGGTSMDKFQTDGVAFFNAMKSISEAAIGVTIDQESMGAVIGIATKLADLQSSLEPIGGVVDWFTGRDDLGTFGTNAGQFIGSMKTAFESLDGATFNTEALTSIIVGSKRLATLQSSLEPIGGVISWFSGRDDLATFGVNVGQFISSMTTALGSLGDTTFNQEALNSIIIAATRLSTLQSSLEPIGGVISWFSGRDDLATFGTNVGQFILSMKTAFSSLDGVEINQEALSAIISSATRLSTLQSSLDSIGGVVDWFSGRDDLATFGDNISQFMSSMVSAFGSLGDVTINQEALDAIISASTKLADLQSSLDSVGGVVDWFTGRDDLATFGTNAGQFVSSMSTAFGGLGDTTINEEAISSIIDAATKLADFQSSLDNVGGVVDWFTGRDDLGTFGDHIGKFAEAMGKLKTGMGEDGITQTVVDSITNAGDAILALNDSLPSEGWFDGKISMSDFADYISDFSDAMKDFSDTASGINSEGINIAITAANRIKFLISSIANLDTSGVAEFTGIGTGGIGADGVVSDIAEAIVGFSEKVAGIDIAAVNTSVSAASRLRTLISNLTGLDASGIENFKPASIGSAIKSYANKVAGIDTAVVSTSVTVAYRLKTLIASLSGLDSSGISNFKAGSVGSAIKAFSTNVKGVDMSSVNLSISAATRVKNFISGLASLDTSGVASFSKAITSLGKINLEEAVSALNVSTSKFENVGANLINALNRGLTAKSGTVKSTMSIVVTSILNSINVKRSIFNTAGSQLMSQLNNGIRSKTSSVKATITTMVTSILNTFQSKNSTFNKAGAKLIENLINGINSKRGSTSTAVRTLVSNASSAISNSYQSFYRGGKYLGEGLVLGIESKKQAAYDAGYALGQAAAKGEKDGQDSNSPSKLTIKYGKWFGEGLVIGIESFTKKVYNAGGSLGETAVDSMSSAISKATDYISGNIDANPTIRPIMDLADIEDGVGAINGMIGNDLTVGASANLGAISSMMSKRSQNGTNADVVTAINGLKKSIGKLGSSTYNINGITYDDGSNITEAVETLVRAARIERRR